jgi:hypothetical protein
VATQYNTPHAQHAEASVSPLQLASLATCGEYTTPTNPLVNNTPRPTYAQIAERANYQDVDQEQALQAQLQPIPPQPYTDSGLTSRTASSSSSANKRMPRSTHPSQRSLPQRRLPVRRRPSRSYHMPMNHDDGLHALSNPLSSTAVPVVLVEINQDPRDVSALVQGTQFGGHRLPVPTPAGESTPSSPTPAGPSSTVSSRGRRTGEAMKDPSLPYSCPDQDCGKTFPNYEGLKYVVHDMLSSPPQTLT